MEDQQDRELPQVVEEALEAGGAVLNITYEGQQGELREPIGYDSTDADVKAFATEVVRAGNVDGIDAFPAADFTDFVVDRFSSKDGLPNRMVLRPKTPFGGG